MENILQVLKFLGATLTAIVTYIWGGFDLVFVALLTLITIDYITGIIAGAYRGELSSKIGYKGLLKKVGLLAVIAVAHVIGQALEIDAIRSFVIGFYLVNESISILENVAKMDVPISQKLLDILKQLKEKEGNKE